MSYSLDTTTTDQYQEFPCPGTAHVTVQVSGAPIFIGFGQGGNGRPSAALYGFDEVLLPTTSGLDRDCDAIRIMNYTAGVSADVKLTASLPTNADADG